MIPLPSGPKIWLVAGITDMRNSFNGLAAKVQTADVYKRQVYNRVRGCASVVHILVTAIQCGIQRMPVYRLVAAGINHSGICLSLIHI